MNATPQTATPDFPANASDSSEQQVVETPAASVAPATQTVPPIPLEAALPPPTLLHIGVVGHTNTGKTSLMRTLMRDPGFGDVQDQPGTTRQVEAARLLVDGQPLVELYDTPGMEDGSALMDYLETLLQPGQRQDGPDRIRQFLDTPESQRRFEQEARVLRKLLECDAGLYVVDVRDPVLGKHKDELAVLSLCGQPLLPVLNFVRSPQARTQEWRDALSRLGLHASVEFDTIAPALDGEAQLIDKLTLLLDQHARTLQLLKEDIARQRTSRRQEALRLIAELLIDVASLRVTSLPDTPSLEQASQMLRNAVRQREQHCVDSLLQCYNFTANDFPYDVLPLQGERWEMDLFHPQALRDMGLHVSKGVAAGAMAGATVDMFTAGLSLGAATLLGATAGGLWQGFDRWGKRIVGRARGYREQTIDDPVLRLLALRQLALATALELRGHAAQSPIRLQPDLGADVNQLRDQPLPPALLRARGHPEWSALTTDYAPDADREQSVKDMVSLLGGG